MKTAALPRLLPIAAILAFSLLCGCVSFVAPYDATFDQEVVAFHRKTEIFLAEAAYTGSRYPDHRAFYAEAYGTIAALRGRALLYGAQKNAGTLAELDLLKAAFEKLEAYDRAGPLRGKGYEAMQLTLSHHFAALQQIELHKKYSLSVPKAPAP